MMSYPVFSFFGGYMKNLFKNKDFALGFALGSLVTISILFILAFIFKLCGVI